MEIDYNLQTASRDIFLYKRPRLNKLFKESDKFPLVLVCAGAGYGKTTAVHDFLRDNKIPTAWMQISESDNLPERFWENYAHAWSSINKPLADAIIKIGFPDTLEKQKQYLTVAHKLLSPMDKRFFVVDDIHYLENPAIIRLAENIANNLVIGTTSIWISRSAPVQVMGMISKGLVFSVSENDLRFTDNELAQYFRRLDINAQPENLREIMKDTEGWAFAINLIARSYQKAPGYGGYLRNAMKSSVFKVMETEIWKGISEKVQRFLIRISLIGHLSYELLELLAGDEKNLIKEMERQSAYIRRDSFINAFLIHPLFLEFLASKQDILSEKQKRETYTIAGQWCDRNGFKIDAMSYYEKMGGYGSIVSIFYESPVHPSYDVSKYAAAIMDRAPEGAFDKVVLLAATHILCNIHMGFWQRAVNLAEHYEAKYKKLPKDNVFRNRNLGGIYFLWGYLRNYMCLFDNKFDFDRYYDKFCKTHPDPSVLNKIAIRTRIIGPWINTNGSSEKGAPEEYIKAVCRTLAALPDCLSGFMAGEDDLARGELKFFQGELAEAETFITQALGKARENRQFELQHRALLYIMRICAVQGNFIKADQALKEIKGQLDEADYPNRFINYDIAQAMSCYAMGLPEDIPDLFKQNFLPYSHASFIENYENQIKARYCYITRNYPPLLAYIEEMKQRESYLYSRVAMLAMESCIHYKKKNKEKAFAVLSEAYETASPNELIMPFIELGKEMRSLTAAVLKEAGIKITEKKTPGKKIPKAWLENINRKAASYAKRQAHMITKYRQVNRMDADIFITPREGEILRDLSHGLSRTEIASTMGLSINTVKMVINNIYSKLGAGSLADLIRIATERKLI